MIAIRQAGEGDLAVVARLFRSVQALHAEHHPEKFFPPAENDTPTEAELAWVRELVAAPAIEILLAELDGKAAGSVVVQEVNREAAVVKRPLRYLVVDHIGVETRFQGQGVGTALLEAVFHRAARRGLPRVELSVWRFNEKARRFFARHGFVSLHERMESVVPTTLESVTPRTRSGPSSDGR